MHLHGRGAPVVRHSVCANAGCGIAGASDAVGAPWRRTQALAAKSPWATGDTRASSTLADPADSCCGHFMDTTGDYLTPRRGIVQRSKWMEHHQKQTEPETGRDRIQTSLGNRTAVSSRAVRGSTWLLLRCGHIIDFTRCHLALRGRRRRCSRRRSRSGRALPARQLLLGSRMRCLHAHIRLRSPLPMQLPRTGAGGTRCRGTRRRGRGGGLRRSVSWRGTALRRCRRWRWEREPCRWGKRGSGLGGAGGGLPGARAMALRSTLACGEAQAVGLRCEGRGGGLHLLTCKAGLTFRRPHEAAATGMYGML